MNAEEQLKKRFEELSLRSEKGSHTFTEFLNIDEQQTLISTKLKHEVFGGYEGSERVMACFPSPWEEVSESDFPISYIAVNPTAGKYSEELSHRDFLGALMSLGFKREMLGDILISGCRGYIICNEKMADYICENLKEVRRTPVKCERIEALPEMALPVPTEARIVVASDRADALVASAFDLSRSEAQEFFASGRVFINARSTLRPDEKFKEGDIISIRGKGRIKFLSFSAKTRKGGLWADILKY